MKLGPMNKAIHSLYKDENELGIPSIDLGSLWLVIGYNEMNSGTFFNESFIGIIGDR